MASQITIKRDLLKDPRFFDLAMKLGSRKLAAGEMLYLYDIVVAHHSLDNDRCLIPRQKWIDLGVDDAVIAVGLAQIEGDLIYVKGARESNAWLTRCKTNGSKGGRPKKPKLTHGFTREPMETQNNLPIPIPIPTLENTEERAPAAADELTLEKALEQIHGNTKRRWQKYTEKSLTDVLEKGFDFFMADQKRLKGRSLSVALVSWVNEEKKHLYERPRATTRQSAPEPEVDIPENTPEQLERARAFAARYNLKCLAAL